MSTLRQRLTAVQQGDHLCLFYEKPAERLATVIEYFRIGLARNEQCLYVCSEETCEDFLETLRRAGLLTPELELRGAVRILDKTRAYLKGRKFIAERMVQMLNEAVEKALDAGFIGLRAAGDMTWILDAAPGTDTAITYEALMNQFYPTARALGLCLYDRKRMAAETLDGAIRTHPRALVEGHICANPFFEPPDVFFNRVHPRENTERKLRQIAALRAS